MIVVVIPVGPGHEELAVRAIESVSVAWACGHGPFAAMDISLVWDVKGEWGRSKARNVGMSRKPADWYFLLDADDTMVPEAFGRVMLEASATFGAIQLNGRTHRRNRWPLHKSDLLRHGADGTLSMGFFMRGDLGLWFDESLDVGEDFDLYMRLPDFVKIKEPLVDIDYQSESAGGPRSSRGADWQGMCRKALEKYR